MSYINPLSTKCWKYCPIYFVMTGNNIHAESFCLLRFFSWETSNIQANIVVSVHSVRKARNLSDNVVPRQRQLFNPMLLFIITLAGRE